MRWAPFLDGYDLTNLTIGGENGTIDGSGAFFWALHDAKKMTSTRPPLWSCVRCTDMVLEDTTFLNAGFWTIHPVLGRRLTARRIYILAPNDAPNTGDTFLTAALGRNTCTHAPSARGPAAARRLTKLCLCSGSIRWFRPRQHLRCAV